MFVTWVLCAILVGLLSFIYWYIKREQSYFRKHGIPYIEPEFFAGNMAGAGETVSFGHISEVLYKSFKGTAPLAGMYFFFKRAYLVLDLDLVKNVLIKDFGSFSDRGMFYNEKDDPLTAHLFSLPGLKWKNLRNKLSPTFTSGKMKFMFPTMVDVGNEFAVVFGDDVDKSSEVEVKDLCGRYTTDVIGSCAFGIDCNSLKDPDNEFLRMGKRSFTERRHSIVVTNLINMFPKVSKALGMKTIPDDISDFFIGIVRSTAEYREKNAVQRNDFMNLLLELKNTATDEHNGLSIEEIAAQAFLFFFAGFETSSTTMSFCLFELAQNQQIQEKARKEIADVLVKHNGQFTHEAMKEMVYLDQIIQETLRKYPVVQSIFRQPVEDYLVPDTSFVIEKECIVQIPVYSIHHDPEIYPNPAVFDPDRFLPEEIANRHSLSWLPFGDGPRNCIGLRFGKMQAIIGLVSLLRNFQFNVGPKTVIPIEFDITNFFLAAKGGIYLHVKKI